MRFLKIIVTVFFITSLANVNICRNIVFQKDKSDSENKQFIGSDFENSISAAIPSREKNAGKKAAESTDLPRLSLAACDYLSAKGRFFHTGNFESSNVNINKYTLVALHCLLTV